MEIGIKGKMERVVGEADTAKTLGSGTLSVFATPAMVALIEETAWRSVEPSLEEGQGTVGTLLHVEHLSPTPVGMRVVCETELVAVDGRKLVFKVEVSDGSGLVGRGVHERFVVKEIPFQQKADAKKGA